MDTATGPVAQRTACLDLFGACFDFDPNSPRGSARGFTADCYSCGSMYALWVWVGDVLVFEYSRGVV